MNLSKIAFTAGIPQQYSTIVKGRVKGELQWCCTGDGGGQDTLNGGELVYGSVKEEL